MSGKRKGLSVEEKRSKMLELFAEQNEFYQLKELEKLCPKLKGITPMSVKDVLQSLVDDRLVDTDKIGTSVYFWAFAVKAASTRRAKLAAAEQALAKCRQSAAQLAAARQQLLDTRQHSAERSDALDRLAQLRRRADAVQAELDTCADCDPEVLRCLQRDVGVARLAVNRWTDNLLAIVAWIKTRLGGACTDEELYAQFGITERDVECV